MILVSNTTAHAAPAEAEDYRRRQEQVDVARVDLAGDRREGQQEDGGGRPPSQTSVNSSRPVQLTAKTGQGSKLAGAKVSAAAGEYGKEPLVPFVPL